jgi:hypothetical protein
MMDYTGIATGGTMALLNALGQLRAELTQLSQAQKLYDYRQDQLRGSVLAAVEGALRAEALVAELAQRVTAVETLLSEEIGRRLTAPVRGEVVVELGHGWQIERVAVSEPETGAVTVCGGGVDYVFTPGYDDDSA